MPVFDRQPPTLDPRDVAASLGKITDYLKYMQERMEYALLQIDKKQRKDV